MDRLSILAPVLNRPELAVPLVESVAEATRLDWELVFILSPGDKDEQGAVKAIRHDRVRWIVLRERPGPGDYAKKINRGFRNTATEWIFQASDDLRFHPRWDEIAIATGERRGAGVVGTNDLCNPGVMRGLHSTHSLIRRAYIDECGGSETPGRVMHEGYVHNWCDNELVEVAMSRGCFAMSAAIVEHLHPMCRKGPMSDTHLLGMSRFDEDRALLYSRRHAWGGHPAQGRRRLRIG